MALEGTIKDFPITNLFQTLGQHKQTGILVINLKDTYITIYFDKGMIVNVESFPKKIENKLGETLVKNGLISGDTLDKALAIQGKTGKKLGEILLGLGILGKEDLKKALRIQATEIIMSIMNWSDGKYKFTKRDVIDWDKEWFEPISIDLLLMETMQMLDEMPLIKKEIPDTEMIFKLRKIEKNIEIVKDEEDEKEDEEVIYITEKDYKILKLVDGTRTVMRILDKSNLSEYETYRALYNLIRKNLIEERKEFDLDNDIKELSIKENTDFFEFIKQIIVFIVIFFGLASLYYTTFTKENIYHPLTYKVSYKALDYQKKLEKSYINYLKDKYNSSENKR
jgi:hypothetical protein